MATWWYGNESSSVAKNTFVAGHLIALLGRACVCSAIVHGQPRCSASDWSHQLSVNAPPDDVRLVVLANLSMRTCSRYEYSAMHIHTRRTLPINIAFEYNSYLVWFLFSVLCKKILKDDTYSPTTLSLSLSLSLKKYIQLNDFFSRTGQPGISLPDEQQNYSFGDRFSFEGVLLNVLQQQSTKQQPLKAAKKKKNSNASPTTSLWLCRRITWCTPSWMGRVRLRVL